MSSGDFLTEFKRATEAKWSVRSINPTLYGFQFERGTRSNVGLSDDEVGEYEDVLGVRFPHDLKAFLREMNGADPLNPHGLSGAGRSDCASNFRWSRRKRQKRHGC
jgi:SMI1/KNR4 family protein SUKH-1